MSFPFTGTQRGHGKAINRPNFNLAMSQGIGRPKERHMEKQLVSGAVRTHTV